MAEAFPNSSFVGYDFHAPSIEQANAHAKTHGLGERVRFETAPAKEIAGRDFDLVTMFDCLHDMGDPRGCAAHMREHAEARRRLDDRRADRRRHPGDNVASPVSRLYYNASTMICVPTSLAQEVGEGLGAQAGEKKLTEVLTGAGFSRAPRHRGSVQHGARGAAVGPLCRLVTRDCARPTSARELAIAKSEITNG